jgi:hypothetical protein
VGLATVAFAAGALAAGVLERVFFGGGDFCFLGGGGAFFDFFLAVRSSGVGGAAGGWSGPWGGAVGGGDGKPPGGAQPPHGQPKAPMQHSVWLA